jgi:ubiquinone/menaquinone biosynthesis C-methylase UbiE
MPQMFDLSDPRYLDEIGWFLYHEKYERDQFGGSYNAERLAYSRLLLNEVVRYLGRDAQWLENKTIISIGCGCTGDLTAFPGAVKIAIDPLLNVYQQLGMLAEDKGNSRTVYMSTGIENLPLLDESADLVIFRNALDHVPDPTVALKECWRILCNEGALFLSVDIGGLPTPDEPTVFSLESLRALLAEDFELATPSEKHPPHSRGRLCSLRILARKKPRIRQVLDKDAILLAYESRIAQSRQAR